MIRLSPAEAVLQDLGIETPEQIDLEAIAWCMGAEVRYAPLESCEARIIGYGQKAIITVDNRHGEARARFSVGHELGHWSFHRGKSSVCRADDIGGHTHAPNHRERIADGYAADLLMPRYLFEREASNMRRSTFATIDQLAARFKTSRTATALRMVDYGPEPAILVCHGPSGRKWFKRGRDVPDKWFPQDQLDAESNALEVLHTGVNKTQPMLIGADAWFDRRDAEDYEVYEQTIRTPTGDILTLLTFKGVAMLT